MRADPILLQYAMAMVGLPYRWAGDDTLEGFDCSGLVQELLAAVGMDPPGDQTAQGLYDHFFNLPCFRVGDSARGLGALVFYGKDAKSVTHVAMMLGETPAIEAGGGGSKTTSRQAAAEQNAFIRIRPYDRRKDVVAIINPFDP